MAEWTPSQQVGFGLGRGVGRGPKIFVGLTTFSEDDTITLPGCKFVHAVKLQTVEAAAADAVLPLVKEVVAVGVSSVAVTVTGVVINGSTFGAYTGYFLVVAS